MKSITKRRLRSSIGIAIAENDNLKLQILKETYPVNYAKVYKSVTRKKTNG